MLSVTFVTAPYLDPLVFFASQYGLMVLGAVMVLVALSGRKFGPFALIPLVIGLGICVAGATHLFPVVGK